MSHAWMPFYVGDYLSDTLRLTTVEHGAYFLLIMEYWQQRSLPNNDSELALIVRLPEKEWKKIRPKIERFFEPGWRHKRCDSELAKADQKSAARSEAGYRGGKSKGKQTESKQQAIACNQLKQNQTDAQASSTQSQPDSSNELFHCSLRSQSSPDEPDDAIVLEEQNQDATPITAARRKQPDKELFLDVVEIWNEGAADLGLPQVKDITDTRQAAIRARCKDFPTYDIAEPLEGFRALMAKIRGSPFLIGATSAGFRATFDFATKSSSFHKIMEGSYEASKQTTGKLPAYSR